MKTPAPDSNKLREVLETIRNSDQFLQLKKAFCAATGLNLWLDSVHHDDPTCLPCANEGFCTSMLSDENMQIRCEHSHQTGRDEAEQREVKFSTCIAGLVHFVVPLHYEGKTIGFLRCGGIKNREKTPNNIQALKELLCKDGHDDDSIQRFITLFEDLPYLREQNLVDAADWMVHWAKKVERSFS